VVTDYAGSGIDSPQGIDPITAGPDGALWFVSPNHNSIGRITAADSVTTTPRQGPSGTALTVAGTGFAGGETVAVTFLTGLSSPASVLLCTATADSKGKFSCSGSVPWPAGGVGTHTLKATGKTSGTKAKTVFLLTT
jgi:hypothetical protein